MLKPALIDFPHLLSTEIKEINHWSRSKATHDCNKLGTLCNKANNLCRDISGSALLFFYLQSWQAAFVILITIGSVSFFTYVGQSGLGLALNWTLVSFVVLLPAVLLLYLVGPRDLCTCFAPEASPLKGDVPQKSKR